MELTTARGGRAAVLFLPYSVHRLAIPFLEPAPNQRGFWLDRIAPGDYNIGLGVAILSAYFGGADATQALTPRRRGVLTVYE